MGLRRNVLIFHAGALGDFVLTWPLAMALGRLHPQSRIIHITHEAKGKLAERVLGVESADVEAGGHRLYAESPDLPEQALQLLADAHSIFTFISTGDDLWAQNVRQMAPEAALLALYPRPDERYARHFSEHLLEQLHPAAAVHAAVRQMLHSIGRRGVGWRRGIGQDVVIHPGSGSREKCWPLDCFIALIDQLRRRGHSIRVILGEVERERWSGPQLDRLSAAAETAQPADYIELLEYLSSAALFIGNDSGPAHLAGIIGIPTLVLFGPTDPVIWRPLGPKVQTIRRQPLETLSVDEVLNPSLDLKARQYH